MLGGVSATDAMVAVRVDVHVKLLVGLYECFTIFGSIAEVYVVVGCTMDDEELAMELIHTVHGR
jgi:hypothetical protein